MSTSSTRILATVAAMWLAASCSSVLGIEHTIADTDGDGVADELDNCVEVPNPTQFDSDADGIGDACATCAAPIGRDADHDGYDDHCDRCIGTPLGVDSDNDGIDDGCETCVGGHGTTGLDVAPHDGLDDGCTFCRDPMGTDIDGDGLDDTCDSCLSGPPHDEDADGVADSCDQCPGGDVLGPVNACAYAAGRVLFDPFVFERTASWPTGAPGSMADDVLRIDTASESYRQSAVAVAGQMTVTLKLARGPVGAGAYVAIVMDAPVPAGLTAAPPAGGGGGATGPIRCTLGSDGILTSDSPGAGKIASATPIDVTQPIWLTYAVRNGIALEVTCSATTPDHASQAIGADPADGLMFGIAALGHVELEWVDVLSGPP